MLNNANAIVELQSQFEQKAHQMGDNNNKQEITKTSSQSCCGLWLAAKKKLSKLQPCDKRNELQQYISTCIRQIKVQVPHLDMKERIGRVDRQREAFWGRLMIYSTMSCGGQEEVVATILVPVLRLLQARQRNMPGLNVVQVAIKRPYTLMKLINGPLQLQYESTYLQNKQQLLFFQLFSIYIHSCQIETLL